MPKDESRDLEALQQRPEWLEWLGRMESGLHGFFTSVVPDMPADPWSTEGARHAEATALQRFADVDAADPNRSPQNIVEIDAFHRYIGEVLIRRFEGRWLYAEIYRGHGPQPVVSLPYSTAELAPRTVLTSLAHRRTGDELPFIVREQAKDYQLWVDAGRPAFAEWEQIRTQLRRQQLRRS